MALGLMREGGRERGREGGIPQNITNMVHFLIGS